MGHRPLRFVMLAMLVALAAGRAKAEANPVPVRLRLGTLAIDGSRYMQDILALSKEIERRTHGSVRLDWISGGRLGDEGAMADLVAHGKLDGGGFSETGLIALVPRMAAFQYAGLFQTYDEVDRTTAALDPAVRDAFAERGLVFAMWADLGFAHLFSIDRIASLRDALSRATPWLSLPIDAKLSAAIAGGRARAWALPPLFTLAIGNLEAHHMSDLRYRYVVGGLVLSRAAWSRLPAADQAAVLAACREWQPRLRESWRRETEGGIAALQKAGIQIYASPAAERAAFLEAAAKSRTAHAAQNGLAELTAKIVDAIASKR
jgi:TRAP-type C4-dicarboxylate transport system substrate-binding protein